MVWGKIKLLKMSVMDIKTSFRAACYLIAHRQMCSKTLLQRILQINYLDACMIIEMLESNKIIEQQGLSQYKVFFNLQQMEVILDLIYK